MLKNLLAVLTSKSAFSVNVSDVRLQGVLVFRDFFAVRARIPFRFLFGLLVSAHMNCEASFVLDEMSADLKIIFTIKITKTSIIGFIT